MLTSAEALSGAFGYVTFEIVSSTSTTSQIITVNTSANFNSLDDASPANNGAQHTISQVIGGDSTAARSVTVQMTGLSAGDQLDIGPVTLEFIPVNP